MLRRGVETRPPGRLEHRHLTRVSSSVCDPLHTQKGSWGPWNACHRPDTRAAQSLDTPSRCATLSPALRPVPSLANLSPYRAVSSLDRIWERPSEQHFKLDWNEASVPPSPRVYEAIVSFLSNSNHLNWYPELGSRSLAESLADYTNVPPSQILVTNGSDDALELVCKTFLDPGDAVLVPQPTYTHFLVYARSRGARVVDFFSRDIFSADVDRLEAQVRGGQFKLVYLVSPNNPTGVVYTRDEVERLLIAAPATLFIVDEAYHEFYGETVVELVNQYDNLVVTRTFSKCFAIAGLRMGYLCTSDYAVGELAKPFNPKSVNRLGQVAAQACLDDLPYYGWYVSEVDKARTFLTAELRRRGLSCYPTPANFILVQLPEPTRFCALLAEQGVYIRDRSDLPRLPNFVRMTLPTLDQSEEVLRRVDIVLAQMRSNSRPAAAATL